MDRGDLGSWAPQDQIWDFELNYLKQGKCLFSFFQMKAKVLEHSLGEQEVWGQTDVAKEKQSNFSISAHKPLLIAATRSAFHVR